MASDQPILATRRWASNAELLADVAKLWFPPKASVLDPTFGRGTFWKVYKPRRLVAHDLKLDGVDFRHLPHPDKSFDVVAFDPPYKLNGTPTEKVDERYGVNVVRTWQQRHALIREGIAECARVAKTLLLIKCQDQVCSGHVRWQTREFADCAEEHGFTLVDRFDLIGGREQPPGRRQVHARRNTSTLLVFKRVKLAACPQKSGDSVTKKSSDISAPRSEKRKRSTKYRVKRT